MKLEHRFTVPVSADVVWGAFDRLEEFVPCVPGAELTSLDGDHFEGSVKVKLGPISMVYSGKGSITRRDRDAGVVEVEAKGRDKRGNGTAGATVTAQIAEADGQTTVELTTDLLVTGKPAQFGRGVIQDVSDKLLGQFAECLSAKLQAERGGQAPDSEGTEPDAGAAPAAPDRDDRPAPPRVASPPPAPAELDLFSTVVPVVLARFRVPLMVAGALLVGILLGRGCRSRGG